MKTLDLDQLATVTGGAGEGLSPRVPGGNDLGASSLPGRPWGGTGPNPSPPSPGPTFPVPPNIPMA